jgi:hypothetical protein
MMRDTAKIKRESWMIRFLIPFLLAPCILVSSCMLISKGKFKSQVNPSMNQSEIDRLKREFAAIEDEFPQPEFQQIAREIYSRFEEIYRNPDSGLKKPALIYILNSLPGSGKNRFVEAVAKAFGIIAQENYKVYEMNQKDYTLNFEKILQFAATAENISNIRQGKLANPLLLLYDEYTHTATMEGADSFGKRLEDIRREMVDGELSVLIDKITSLQKDIQDLSSDSARNATEANVRSQVSAITNLISNVQRVHESAIQSISNMVHYEKNSGNLASIKADAEKQMKTLWASLGNGMLPKEDLKSNKNVSNELTEATKRISGILLSRQKQFLEQIAKNIKLKDLQIELEQQEDKNLPASKPTDDDPDQETHSVPGSVGASGGLAKPRPTEPPTPVMSALTKQLIEEIEKLKKDIELLEGRITTTEQELNQAAESVRPAISEIVSTYTKDIFDTFAEGMNINPEQFWSERSEEEVRQITAANKIDAQKLREAAPELIAEMTRTNSVIGPVENLLSLFKRAPQQFLDVYQTRVLTRSASQDRYTGNVIIFLAGNVLNFQEKVISTVLQEGPNICAGEQTSGLPYFRNPDCLLTVTQKLLKEGHAKDEMETALKRVLGGKIFEIFDEKKTDLSQNQLAFESRVGPARFILPPSSADYRAFLMREMGKLSKSFYTNTGVELAFEPEVVDDFLFPKYVNSAYGFRNLGDKARAQFKLFLDQSVESVVKRLQLIQSLRDKEKQAKEPSSGVEFSGDDRNALNSMVVRVPVESARGKVTKQQRCDIMSPGLVSRLVARTATDELGKPLASRAIALSLPHRVVIGFDKDRLRSSTEGEVVVKSQETKGSNPRVVEWFRVRETVMDEQDSNSNRISDAERIRISYLLGSTYGGLAAIFENTPDENIPLQLTATGEPLAAARNVPFGYDWRRFHIFLELRSLEIQSYIAGVAAYYTMSPLIEKPQDIMDRRINAAKYKIHLLYSSLKGQLVNGLDIATLLSNDQHGEIVGKPQSESDFIFRELYPKLVEKRPFLTEAEVDSIYDRVLGEFTKMFRTREVANRTFFFELSSLILTKLDEGAARDAVAAPLLASEIGELLEAHLGIVSPFKSGVPTLQSCALYRQEFLKRVESDSHKCCVVEVGKAAGGTAQTGRRRLGQILQCLGMNHTRQDLHDVQE